MNANKNPQMNNSQKQLSENKLQKMFLLALMLLVGVSVDGGNIDVKMFRLDDFKAEIFVPIKEISFSENTDRYHGTKVYYFDLKHMSWSGANINVIDQPAPNSIAKYKSDAVDLYKRMKATINHCSISKDGKEFTLDVSDVVMFNTNTRIFQKAIFKGDTIILATGYCSTTMPKVELDEVKSATYSLRLISNNKKFSMSDSEKALTLKHALKGLQGDWWNSMEPDKGFNLIKNLAEDGYAPAQVELGHIYEFGKKPINKRNVSMAVYWYAQAAKQGNHVAENSLGVHYQNGDGVPKDIAYALQLYRRAANGDDAFANFNLGCNSMRDGRFHEAKEYYLKAAAKSHPTAMYNIGTIYYEGKGESKNIGEAVYWFERAASLGEANAQNNLGWILGRGENGVVDTKRATYLFEQAAKQGHTSAKKNLEYVKRHGSLLN